MVSIPNRCIWCLRQTPDVAFSSVSHVLPKCVGNERQQILPKGVVCDKCNNYFGQQTEPALLNDPIFHIIAVVLRFQHPGKNKLFRTRIFDEQHRPVKGEHQTLHCDTEISDRGIILHIDYSTKGQISKSYELKDLAFLSRAVHKICFESLAWGLFVKGWHKEIDLFDSGFDVVRKWTRYGEPIDSVRPVLRLQRLDTIKPNWEYRMWGRHGVLFGELNLFGDWYGVSLTSSSNKAGTDLKSFTGAQWAGHPIWCIGENFMALDRLT